MTVHSTLKTDDAQSVIEWLAPIPGLPASALFEEEGTPIHGASNADLRNLVLSLAGGCQLRKYRVEKEEDPAGLCIDRTLEDAAGAIAAGRSFDLGRIADFPALLDRQPGPDILPELFVPYPVTPVTILIAGQPWLFALRSDERGLLVQAVIVALSEIARIPFLEVLALLSIRRAVDGEPCPVIRHDATRAEVRQVSGYLGLAWTLLAIINDDRVPARRNITSTKHNAARLKIGKPAIPDLWRLDLSAGAESYTTPIHPRRKSDHKGRHAGMHASPIAHDRRGHRRRLRSGRTVWVRSCQVGTLIKHMTRKREFYRV